MEFIFEFIFDLIVEGSVEVLGEKKVPVFLRILAGIIVILVYGGIVGLIVYLGISDKSWGLLVIGAALIVLFTIYIWKTVKKHRS